ncbi:globin [Ectobacillus ponti]|uniref:Globin n=1 Tax=Ectobacillus ponti TaxID=2961894 RepID=A0AA41X693_9BACI|nr:globin [Ectobacillus ponti]MCP8969472.1 globin [Ectobacillus ponti]
MQLQTIYEQVGGAETIRRIVETFYPKVYSNEKLRPLFHGDMEEIMRKQYMFLTQLTGGEPLYSQEFGPPNMRMRHLPFEITPERAQEWLRLMKEVFDEMGLSETEAGQALFARLTQIAPIMVNTMLQTN